MKTYVELAEAYKIARRKGMDEEAEKVFEVMREMRKSGKVTEDEMIAAAYI